MSYKITEPLMWHLPAGLPSGHRMVLVALTVKCHDRPDRRVRCPRADLAQLTGLSESRVKNVLADLADRFGIEVRVPLDKDVNGRPVYAVPGQWPTFELPVFPPPTGCRCPACNGRPQRT